MKFTGTNARGKADVFLTALLSQSPAVESMALYFLRCLPRIDVTSACPVHTYRGAKKLYIHRSAAIFFD
jgi:hypothetical protein